MRCAAIKGRVVCLSRDALPVVGGRHSASAGSMGYFVRLHGSSLDGAAKTTGWHAQTHTPGPEPSWQVACIVTGAAEMAWPRYCVGHLTLIHFPFEGGSQ